LNEPPQPAELAKEYAAAIFVYIVRVVADAFRFCRRLFSYALGILILWLLFSMNTSRIVLFADPLCSISIVSPMICHWDVLKASPTAHSSAGRPIRWADDMQTKPFDQLLDGSVGNGGPTLEEEMAEMAGYDLITSGRVSDLKSKDQIAEQLGKFVDDAKGTGQSLHELAANVHGAMDS
jgi:hypothetical protein